MSRYLIWVILLYACLFSPKCKHIQAPCKHSWTKSHGFSFFYLKFYSWNTKIPMLLFPWQYTFEHVSFIELYTSNRNSMSVSWFAVEEPDMLGISWWHVKTKDKSMHISKKARLFLMKLFYSSHSIQSIPMITIIEFHRFNS